MKKLYVALAVGACALGFALLATAFTGESSATAKKNFCNSLFPGDYTVAQDIDALQPELNAFPQAFNDTFDGSGCSSSAS